MKTSVTGVVLCRLAAVLLLFQAIENVGFLLFQPATFAFGIGGLFAVAGISVVSPALAAALIWILAERVCRIKNSNGDPDISSLNSTISESQLIAIGTLLVGLYALLFGILAAGRTEIGFFVADKLQGDIAYLSTDQSLQRLGNRVPYLLQILLGILLVVGRNQLARILKRIRYAR